MRKVIACLALAAASVGVTACGSDSSSSTSTASSSGAASVDTSKMSAADKAAYEAVLASMEKDEGDMGATEAQQQCVATKIVKSMGAAGATALAAKDGENLSKADAEKAAAAFSSCVDIAQLFVDEMTDGANISEKSAACVKKAFDAKALQSFLVESFQNSDAEPPAELFSAAMTAMTKCLTPDELKALGS